jgi:hypothetical protein
MNPPRSLVRAFLALYVTLGLVILIESVVTVLAAHGGHGFRGPDRLHAQILGSAEAVAAVAFLVPRAMSVGATALLAIFALAFGLHLLQGSPNLVLLVYGSGVLFVRVHGVAGYHWT